MKLNRNTDIIRTNNIDFGNVKSTNTLIQQRIAANADEARSFKMLMGSRVDAEVMEEMNGTYWMNMGPANSLDYDEDVQIVER